MSLEQAFLTTMLEDPDDDTTPLVFADWLDDQGDPRGEFLRIERELAAWVPDCERRTELTRRSSTLFNQHQTAWVGGLRQYCESTQVVDGLLHVTMSAEQFLSRSFAAGAREMLRRAWVREVRLTGVTTEAALALARASHLEHVTALVLEGNRLGNAGLSALLTSPHLKRLRHLGLADNDLEGISLQRIAENPNLANLRSLDLRNNDVPPAATWRFLHGGALPSLRELRLDGNEMEAELCQELALWHQGRGHPDWTGERPARLVNSLGMEFVLIPAGSFLMGSGEHELDHRDNESPEHVVQLTQPFYLAIYQVTQPQFQRLTGRNPSSFSGSTLHPGRQHPVDTVSREDAQTFCDLLSEIPEERKAGRRYRLPTEAEWEHACRGGVSSWPTFFGRSLSSFQANFDGGRPYGRTRRGPYLQRTTPVGNYPPNRFGLYDMHGNVWEWCQDDYHSRAYKTRSRIDPLVLEEGSRGVLRGGSWHSDGPWCRSAYRCSDSVDSRYNWNGFRVVCELGGSA